MTNNIASYYKTDDWFTDEFKGILQQIENDQGENAPQQTKDLAQATTTKEAVDSFVGTGFTFKDIVTGVD